jgi:hypothetical protein
MTATQLLLHAKFNASRRLAAITAACAITAFGTTPGLAHAGEGDAPAANPAKVEAEPAPAPAPDVSPEPSAKSEAPTSAPVMAGGSAAPPPRVDDRLSLTGSALWEGMKDRSVRLSLKNGAELEGRVVAQAGSDIALARASDGMVVSVPKAEIAGVRVARQPSAGSAGELPLNQRPRDSGRSLHTGGAFMLGFGVPLGLSGTVMLGICPGCVYIHLPLLLPGIGLIIGGSIAMKKAKERRAKFNRAWGIPLAGRMRMTPTLALTRGGGELGFSLRF